MPTKTTKGQALQTKVRVFVVNAIKEVLDDPDFGLELTERAKKRLRQTSRSKRKTISLSEIKRRYS